MTPETILDCVVIRDRPFVLDLPYPVLRARIELLAQTLNAHYAGREVVIVPVLSGSYRFAAELMPLLTFPFQLDFVKASSYGAEMTGAMVRLTLDVSVSLTGKAVLLIEDIVDTGHTLDFLNTHLAKQTPESIACVSLLFKPGHFKGQNKPDWSGFDIGNDFVVGFGLDYAEEGRWLNGVYKLAP